AARQGAAQGDEDPLAVLRHAGDRAARRARRRALRRRPRPPDADAARAAGVPGLVTEPSERRGKERSTLVTPRVPGTGGGRRVAVSSHVGCQVRAVDEELRFRHTVGARYVLWKTTAPRPTSRSPPARTGRRRARGSRPPARSRPRRASRR